jgi:hypothetical protein
MASNHIRGRGFDLRRVRESCIALVCMVVLQFLVPVWSFTDEPGDMRSNRIEDDHVILRVASRPYQGIL